MLPPHQRRNSVPRHATPKCSARSCWRHAAVPVQAQVLLVNAIDMAMRIPRELMSRVIQYLTHRKDHTSSVFIFISSLVGVSVRFLRRLFSSVRDNGWEPCQDFALDRRDKRGGLPPPKKERGGLPLQRTLHHARKCVMVVPRSTKAKACSARSCIGSLLNMQW